MRWPGERLRAPRPTSSCSSPNLASSERASCWVSPLCSTNASISVPSPSKPARAWSSVPIRTPGPTQRSPADSGSRPSRPSTSVVFPLPFGPTSATRSPHASSRSSGPRTKLPRRSSAPSSRAVTSPERSPPPKRSCSSQRFHGFSTTSSRSSAFSDARTLPACFSERSARRATRLLSGSEPLAFLHARLGPLPLAVHAVGQARRAARCRTRSAPRRGARRSRAAPGSPPSRRRTRSRCGRSRRARARA